MGRREKPQDFVVWPAGVDAAAAIADLAEARRQVYRTYSPVFWRPAPDARARHLPFLSACLADGHHTAFVAESAGATVAAVIADHHVRTPPFAQDREASWLVDDFYVAAPGWWDAAGGALLESVAAVARRSRQERLIVVSAGRDDPKNAMLQHRGFQQAAQWWVRWLEPPKSPVPAEGEHP